MEFNSQLIFVFSVVVREDKKLLTVLFPDGRDGRAFTLKVLKQKHQILKHILYNNDLCTVVNFSICDQLG